jgi:hypothetical protein
MTTLEGRSYFDTARPNPILPCRRRLVLVADLTIASRGAGEAKLIDNAIVGWVIEHYGVEEPDEGVC